MNLALQTEPITTVVRDHAALVPKLDHGPLILSDKSQATAVLLSIGDWDLIKDILAQLRRSAIADKRDKEMDENPEMKIPFTYEELVKRGILHG
ncbi:MAG: hypothetical protein AAF639_20430 [Chloroflexota bacterium]